MKPINRKVHGIFDHLFVVVFIIAPSIFSFSSSVAIVSYILAGIFLVVAILTDFNLGVLDLVPVETHRLGGLFIGIVLALYAFFPAVSNEFAASLFFTGIAYVIILVNVFTDFNPDAKSVMKRSTKEDLSTA